VTIRFSEEAIANWISRSTGRRGGQRLYSNLAIETSLTLRIVFGLPIRQAEGFIGFLLRMPSLDHLPVPDHSTLSRRARSLDVLAKPTGPGGPIHLIVDSTGLQVVGEDPWAAAKHGTKGTRDWRQPHTGFDEHGFLDAHHLTGSRVDDASVVGELPSQFSDQVEWFTADGAYDKTAVHDLVTARGADVVVPPTKSARLSGSSAAGAPARNATVESVHELGRRERKKRRGYYHQARVESSVYRTSSSSVGDREAETLRRRRRSPGIAINVLNRMLALGASRSEPVRN